MNDTTPPPPPLPAGAAPQPDANPQPGPAPSPASSTGAWPTPEPMLESTARTIAMLVHLSAILATVLSGGLLSFLAPLIIWLLYRERSALVDFHGKAQLNLQLTLLTVVVGGTVLGIATVLFGFILTVPLMIAYAVYAIVMAIIAAVRANRGEYYAIPLVIPYVR
ncbi:DUF4870 domain-containing protein [Demequina pelophila]|uniref:DUF4870 domain-containing protein n=1 Tax=Demequina pelophila TaxID=1638984 RepID=UPI00078641B3|nr:DUF4870 domain-containing protein [Demequina pelophila]